jgi:U3 small nucleolar RNA-associated protein 5
VPDGTLDVELAELSLGQRLRISKGDEGALSDSDFSTTSVERGESKIQASKQKRAVNGSTNGKELRVPTTSLAHVLTQALHSSDTRLLEACLAHTDSVIIMNTVRRVPPQLALVLLDVCVERLGRGRRGNAGTEKASGAGAQRGTVLVRWMNSVLVVHGGSLMTVRFLLHLGLLEANQAVQMPDLVARLSSLHATLTARLALQERLLTLSGRLGLVLAQIELQSSRAPAPLVPQPDKKRLSSNVRQPTRYVEGESTDEDEIDVEIEQGSGDDGSDVEEIGLGGLSESSSEVDEGEDDEDEELEGSDTSGSETGNAFIDDEAEDDWESDEEEDDDDDE